MMESATPREMLKGLLQGTLPPRPLFLPIVFSLGARVESVPLRAFLTNPTKIFNALRRMRTHLRADGVACYFDPCLEAEALGATIDWDSLESPALKGRPPRLSWSAATEKGTLPEGLASPEQAIGRGRVGVAVDVIRRLNAVLRDGSILMAGVTGPFTLAARLTGLEGEQSLRPEDLPREALEFAASFVTLLASAFVEAGANLIFIQEDALPILSAESCDDWASLLAPTLNITRFYQALPVLYFSGRAAAAENRIIIFQRQWDCVLCSALDALPAGPSEEPPGWESAPRAIALPLEAFQAADTSDTGLHESLGHAMAAFRPAILTTAGDVPPGTDMTRLLKVLGEIPRAF
jgi:hypothetical protein